MLTPVRLAHHSNLFLSLSQYLTHPQYQNQNKDLVSWKEENERIQTELRDSLKTTEESMEQANSSRLESEKMREEAESSRIEAEKAKEEATSLTAKVQSNKNVLLIGGGILVVGIIAYMIFKKK